MLQGGGDPMPAIDSPAALHTAEESIRDTGSRVLRFRWSHSISVCVG